MASNGAGISSKMFVGFKASDLETNYQRCGANAEKIVSLICKQTQAFLDEIANHWASPEAVKYCEDRVADLNRFLTGSASRISNALTSIKQAGDKWASTTGYNLVLPSRTTQINNSVIRIKSNARESIKGLVGADVDILRGFNPNILTLDVSDEIRAFLNNARGLGFIGANQMQSLEESLNAVLDSFKTTLTTISDHIKSFLSQIAEKYSDTAGEIGTSFQKLQNNRDSWDAIKSGFGNTD